MSDLFRGRTMTYAAEYEADGGAHTFEIPFQPDRIMVVNYTAAATDQQEPVAFWYRGMPAGKGIHLVKIANDGGSDASSIVQSTSTNGFTEANTAGGPTNYKVAISGISQADPCVVTTGSAHGYATGDIVRLTKLGDAGAVDYGMDQLNNNRYKIVVLTSTTFSLQDPISGADINSTSYDAYSSGGQVNLETRVDAEEFAYADVTYRVTFGTEVAGADGDQVFFEAIKFGEYENLGDIA